MSVEFTLQLAGRKISVKCGYPQTKEFCREYLTEGTADFAIEVGEAELAFEREQSYLEQAAEKTKEGAVVETTPREYKDSYLETLAVYRKIAVGMLDYDTILFHGSVIAVDGVGYLFAAKSGTGKSTHTRLWRELFGERAVMINDDKPLLRITGDGVMACGTPWNGKHRLGTNLSVPLKAICILKRAPENHIAGIGKKEAYPMLVQQTYRPLAPAALLRTMNLVDRLAAGVELYQLGCNMDLEAAQVAYNGMK